MPYRTGIGNPWRRLPWVLFISLFIWGAFLWGFGLLLQQVTEGPHSVKPLEAQLIELRPPVKHVAVPEPPRPIPTREVGQQTPRQVERAPAQSPGEKRSLEPAVQTPVEPSPVVLPPETNLPAGHKATSEGMEPAPNAHARNSPNVAKGATTAPPQFGAAYLNNPKPGYPAAAKRMGMEGIVLLKVLVSRDGNALKIEIAQSSGHDILDKSATEAVRNWRFVPARQGDFPVEEWVQVPVAFHLKR